MAHNWDDRRFHFPSAMTLKLCRHSCIFSKIEMNETRYTKFIEIKIGADVGTAPME